MEEVGNLFGEVAQLAVLAKPYLVGAYHLLPPQRPPANVVITPSSKMVGDLTPPLSTGPDIASDAQAAALVWVLALSQIHPPPVRSQRGLYNAVSITSFMLPVVLFKAFIAIVDSRCTIVC